MPRRFDIRQARLERASSDEIQPPKVSGFDPEHDPTEEQLEGTSVDEALTQIENLRGSLNQSNPAFQEIMNLTRDLHNALIEYQAKEQDQTDFERSGDSLPVPDEYQSDVGIPGDRW